MSDRHKNLIDSELHVAKGHVGAGNGSSLWKDEIGEQSWDNRNILPAALKHVSSAAAPPTEVDGDIYLINDSRGTLDVNSIVWQSGNTIRYNFTGSPNLSTYIVGDYLTVISATNAVNNGTFVITAVNDGSDYVEVTNVSRSSGADDEAPPSPAVASSTLSNWDGCPQNSWARFNSAIGTWNPVNPITGILCFNKNTSTFWMFNGTIWVNLFIGGAGLTSKLAYTIGVAGVAGVDYNFTSVANTTEQSIQLGASNIIPANSHILSIVAKCTDGLNGAATATTDIGNTSGGDEWMSLIDLDDTNEINSVSTQVAAKAAASSIYFSVTPDTNWDLLTTGKWKVWIVFIDNSI